MRKRISFGFLAICLGICQLAYAQQNNTKQQADYAFSTLGYSSSVDLYEEIGADRLNALAKIRLADSYRLNSNTESAEYWYAQALEETGEAKDILHYAQMLQSNGKCEAAIEQYNEYLERIEETEATPRATIKDCSELDFKAKTKTFVTNMEALNSTHLDFSPVPYKNGIIFTSTRGNEKSGVIDQWTNDNFTDLFFASKTQGGAFNTPELLKGTLNEVFHDGTATFDKSGTRMYFTRNSEGKNSREVVDLKIYSAELKEGVWTNAEELPINNKEFATCHPALSADGRALYFASNRPGGMGGMDLYVVRKLGKGWSGPRNLGPKVNTTGNEIFPFMNHEGQLFFASNGHQGMGGLDVYVSEQQDGEWIGTENLGAPFNSIKDDFGFSMLKNGKEGYFSSNRKESLGGDDIFHWQSDELAVRGLSHNNTIAVIDEATGERIPEALITIAEGIVSSFDQKTETSNADKEINNQINFLTDSTGMVNSTFATGKTYTVAVNKPGYTSYKKVVSAYELMKAQEWIVAIAKRKGALVNGSVINKKYDHAIPNAEISLFNFCTGENEKALSDNEGKFTFFLDCKCDYELVGEKERFTKAKKTISTINMNCDDTHPITTTLYLNIGSAPTTSPTRSVPITSSPTPPPPPPPAPTRVVSAPPTYTPPPVPTGSTVIRKFSDLSDPSTLNVGTIITLDNLYYDYDKFFIRPDASKELDKVVALMRQYPTMELELSSHTDSRGRDAYNQTLSQKRADVAVNYISSKGISRTRLISRGMGEELLRNECADGVDCSETEHQENRRTEIKIVKR